MQKLLQYIFTKYISEEISQLIPELYKLKSITLSSSQKISSNDLQIIQYLLAKNFITYSPTHMQIKLNVKSVLFYQRVYKIKHFVKFNMSSDFYVLLQEFIKNQFLPVKISTLNFNGILNGHQKSKQGLTKKKLKQQVEENNDNEPQIDYGRLVYEYSQKKGSKEEEIECMINLNQISQLLYFKKLDEHLGNRKKQYLKHFSYKEGQEPLKSLSFNEMYKITKENRPKSQAIKEIINKVKEQKIQEYILQIFRKYDIEQKKPQQQKVVNQNMNVSRNALLIFNMVRKKPFISQKELMSATFNGLLDLRKCLNLLVAQGIINYYPENIRSIIYKISNYDQIVQKFVNNISQAILNLHIASGNSNLSKEQLMKLQFMIGQLDDTLILFGY